MISHELKTPLTTIKEGTSLLLEGVGGSITEKQNRLLTIISTESKRLTGLVNSILDLSKMEAGMMMYTFEQRRIAPLIDQAVKEIAPYAEAKGIHMAKEINSRISHSTGWTEIAFSMCCGICSGMRSNLPRRAVSITIAANPAGRRAEGFRKRFGSRYPQGSVGAHIRKVRKFGSKKRDGTGIGYRQTHRGGTWRKGMGGKRSGKRKHDSSLSCRPDFSQPFGLCVRPDDEHENGGRIGRGGAGASGFGPEVFCRGELWKRTEGKREGAVPGGQEYADR